MGSNPVTREILKLKRQWEQEVENSPGTRLFRWLGDKSQLQLVDSFVTFQLSEESFGNHRFLRYVHEFTDPSQHGQYLVTDVEELLSACYHHYSATNPDFPMWETKGRDQLAGGKGPATDGSLSNGTSSGPSPSADAAFFSRNVDEMVSYYGLKDFETLVVVFSPSDIKCSVQDYRRWVSDFAGSLRHPRVKVMLYDTPSLNLYGPLKRDYALPMKDLTPAVNMSRLMAATMDHQTGKGKDSEPGLDVQKLVLEAGDLFGRKKHDRAFKKTEMALHISRKAGLRDLEFQVHVLRSNFYRSLKKSKPAVEELDLAIASASSNPLLCLQGLLFKGGFLLEKKEYGKATESFAAGLLLCSEHGSPGLTIETYRLFAWSARKAHARDHAWEAYVLLLDYVRQLPPDQVRRSTFGLAAKQMLDICSVYGVSHQALEAEFRSLLGDDWDKIKEKKKVSSPTSR